MYKIYVLRIIVQNLYKYIHTDLILTTPSVDIY